MRLRQRCSGAWIALLAAAADRVTKVLAMRAQPAAEGVLGSDYWPLIPGILNLRLTSNTGMAFSGLSGHGLLLTVVTALLVVGLTAWLIARPKAPKVLRAGLWLIVGGGLGNLYDRLVHGAVIDFLDPAFVNFAVFNVADACICVGAVLALVGVMIADWRRGEADD